MDELDEDALFDRLAKNLRAVREDADLVRSQGFEGLSAGLARAEAALHALSADNEALRQRIEQYQAVAERIEAAAAKSDAEQELLRQTVNELSRRVRVQAELLDQSSGQGWGLRGTTWAWIGLAVVLAAGAAAWAASGREPTLGTLAHRVVQRLSVITGIDLGTADEPAQSDRSSANMSGDAGSTPPPQAAAAPVLAGSSPVPATAAIAPAAKPVAAPPVPAASSAADTAGADLAGTDTAGHDPSGAAPSRPAETPVAAAPSVTVPATATAPAPMADGSRPIATAVAVPSSQDSTPSAPPPFSADVHEAAASSAPLPAGAVSQPDVKTAAAPVLADVGATPSPARPPAAAASPVVATAPLSGQTGAATAVPAVAPAPPPSQPAVLAPAASPSPSPPSPALGPPQAHRVLVLKATADTWVEVRQAVGRVLLTRNMKAGDTWPVPAEPDLILDTGNADGLVLEIDGVPKRLIGAKGGVLHHVPLDADLLSSGAVVRARP